MWHGFNSGMLAASRMHLGLSVAYKEDLCEDESELQYMYEYDGNIPTVSERLAAERKQALDQFPQLDT